MPRNYRFKRRRTSRRSNFRRRGYKRSYGRYGDERSKGVKGYLRSQGTIRNPSFNGYCPEGLETTLTYCETVQITTTAGVNDYYVWAGNSLFDPNVTGGGTQPFGFDQWAAIYTRYLVYASQATVEACITSTASVDTYTFKILLVPFSLTTALSSLSEDVVSQMPHAKSKTCSVYNEGQGNMLSSYISTARVYGVSPAYVEMDDTYGATMAANPSRLWGWWVKVNTMAEGGSTTYNVRMKIRYYCKLLQPDLSTGS